MADALLRDMEQKASTIRKAIAALQNERGQVDSEYRHRMSEIDRQVGRLQSFLVRLGGGAAAPAEPKPNGKAARLSPQQAQQLKIKVMELAGHHGKDGLRRSDVTSALDVTGAQATRLLADLEQANKLKAQGERAARRYFVG